MRQKIFDLTEQAACTKHWPAWLVRFAENRLGFTEFNRAHDLIEADLENNSSDNFFRLACKYIPLHYDVEGLENIPKEGPCVIVCNHPHGMSDGLMFGDAAMRVRSDVRIICNEWLNYVRAMRPYTIQVDVYGGDAAKRANMRGMRDTIKWLREGHCILVFPSGSAATFSCRDARVIDDPWQTNIASIIRKTGATVVPMNISGRTGILFQIVSVLAKPYRAALLAREIKRDQRTRHRLVLGKAISPNTISQLPDDEALSDYLRLSSMLLRYPLAAPTLTTPERKMEPIDPPEDAEVLQRELDACADNILYSNDSSGLVVYALEAAKVPRLMHEIGVQRERTYRAVGEGSGKACDLDAYDEHYVHLVMWDSRKRALAGAYRMGRTDHIVQTRGRKGIYNSLFFHLCRRLIRTLGNGLEMGRAFITAPYQRMPASLDTLWMGIGRFINKHPEYRYLYGTVSISQNYTPASRSLMLSYLRQHAMEPGLSRYIHAYEPPRALEIGLRSQDRRLLVRALPELKFLNTQVSALEPDGKGIPVLLRQYLRLGGRMVAFNVDSDFGDTLDCFVVVDLENAPKRLLDRYCGKNA